MVAGRDVGGRLTEGGVGGWPVRSERFAGDVVTGVRLDNGSGAKWALSGRLLAA